MNKRQLKKHLYIVILQKVLNFTLPRDALHGKPNCIKYRGLKYELRLMRSFLYIYFFKRIIKDPRSLSEIRGRMVKFPSLKKKANHWSVFFICGICDKTLHKGK